jgi:parvulin-like peptidyl-prolyl isomerase
MFPKDTFMRILRWFLVCSIVVLIVGISLAQKIELAKVDDFTITDSYFKQRLEIFPEHNRIKVDKVKFLNKLIDEELLLREAAKLNIQEKQEYKIRLEAIKRELSVDVYLKEYFKEQNTEENQKKYYEENKEKYTSPEMVSLSIITVKTEDEAKNILKKIEEGKDFAELAKEYSIGPTASKGGDISLRPRKAMKKEFADIVSNMKIGEIKGPVRTEADYSIVKLTDRKEQDVVPFENVKNKIANDYAKKLSEDKISGLRKAAKLQINSAELDKVTIN